jgi:sulfate adenylyltransferase subunit 1
MSGSHELLRFTTAGSVDDGKSTLIGRLLYDSKSIFEDQLQAIKTSTERRGREGVDLALLTDGLTAEREQGITIDVAYRYFATPKRKFIIADTPGHEQYTRNMVTGASTADLALILVDANKGLSDQSRRHAVIADLLGIPHVLVCVNKMDLVGHDEAVFKNIEKEFRAFAAGLKIKDARFVPISALNGDNVVARSESMPWYPGSTVLDVLETVPVADLSAESGPLRFPVQWVNRPNANFRGYCGAIAGGVARPGQAVTVLPSGKVTRIKSISTFDGELKAAVAPMSVALVLEHEIDVGRGDVIADVGAPPKVASEFLATLCWMTEAPLKSGNRYLIKHGCKTVKAVVKDIRGKIDCNTLQRLPTEELGLNEIAEVAIKSASLIAYDTYADNRRTGSFIVIDETTNNTVGAGMIV